MIVPKFLLKILDWTVWLWDYRAKMDAITRWNTALHNNISAGLLVSQSLSNLHEVAAQMTYVCHCGHCHSHWQVTIIDSVIEFCKLQGVVSYGITMHARAHRPPSVVLASSINVLKLHTVYGQRWARESNMFIVTGFQVLKGTSKSGNFHMLSESQYEYQKASI